MSTFKNFEQFVNEQYLPEAGIFSGFAKDDKFTVNEVSLDPKVSGEIARFEFTLKSKTLSVDEIRNEVIKRLAADDRITSKLAGNIVFLIASEPSKRGLTDRVVISGVLSIRNSAKYDKTKATPLTTVGQLTVYNGTDSANMSISETDAALIAAADLAAKQKAAADAQKTVAAEPQKPAAAPAPVEQPKFNSEADQAVIINKLEIAFGTITDLSPLVKGDKYNRLVQILQELMMRSNAEAKRLLSEDGKRPNPADGFYGTRTANALSEFITGSKAGEEALNLAKMNEVIRSIAKTIPPAEVDAALAVAKPAAKTSPSPAVKKAGQVSITGKTATTPKGTKLTFL